MSIHRNIGLSISLFKYIGISDIEYLCKRALFYLDYNKTCLQNCFSLGVQKGEAIERET